MSNVTQLIQARHRRLTASRRSPAGKFGLGCATLISLVAVFCALYGAWTYSDLTKDLPSVEKIPTLLDPPNGLLLQPTQLYDRSGEHLLLTLENPAASGRRYLEYVPESAKSTPDSYESTLPEGLVKATLAAIDPYFWRHPGFPLPGIFPANYQTLAQRLASEFLVQGEPAGLRRALRERILAAQITNRYGREKVVEWYLNSANYGRLAYGADAAARLYFGKAASDLNLAEAAVLAAVADSPSLNPIDAPQAAVERQKGVIQSMLRHRMVTPDEGVQAARQELDFRESERQGQAINLVDLAPNFAPAFANLALSELETAIPRSVLERGGLRIITSLDYELQQQLACTIQAQLERLQSAPNATLAELPDCKAARLLPTLPNTEASTLDNLNAYGVVLEPATGQILALMAPPSTGLGSPSPPNQSPGSILTPFVYLTAFARGMSPSTLVWDVPSSESEINAATTERAYLGPLRLRQALANDYLAPAEQVLNQVGLENVFRSIRQFGINPITAPEKNEPQPFSLTEEANLVEITRAFGVFANQGLMAGRLRETSNGAESATPNIAPQPADLLPVTTLRVEDSNGKDLFDWTNSQTLPIITPQLAYLLTNVLSDETARWPSLGHPNALEIGRPAAVKIGGTEEQDSYWTVGYIPQLVVGIWMGLEESRSGVMGEGDIKLSGAAAGLWHAVIQYASHDLPPQSWTIPSAISTLQVCDPSGLLPTKDCPNTVNEVFLAGSEPIQPDTLYRGLLINRETNLLATIFTPPDLIEERSYMVVPPEATEWAQQAGLKTPPEEYDLIPSGLPGQNEVAILSPQMFAFVHGRVPITGSATGEEFVSYRLQVGQGLIPQTWLQIGEDGSKPVTNGQLGVWDTSNLNGLYAIQLLVEHQDQSVERATVLVTVDNQPPEIDILYPNNNTGIQASPEGKAVLQANAQDEFNLSSVEFFLDGELLVTLIQPPYAISWEAAPGAHTLRVVATDQAGNSSEAVSSFTVEQQTP